MESICAPNGTKLTFLSGLIHRLALHSYVREVGTKPTVKQQIEMTKQRSKLLTQITDHQRHAKHHLGTDWNEEVEFGYEPSQLLDVGINGDIVLIKSDSPGK